MRIPRIASLLIILYAPLAWSDIDAASVAGKHWYGLYMNGQKAGYASSEIRVGEDGVVVLIDDASFKLNMVGMKQDMRIYSKRTYSESGELLKIVSRVDDISGTNLFEATVQGESLILDSNVAGQNQRRTLPRPNESLEDALKRHELVSASPKVGEVVHFFMFEPMYQLEIEGRSEIAGVEERMLDGVNTTVYKVETVLDLMSIESTSFITESGVVLEDEIGNGIITMRLEPEKIAKDVEYSNDVIVSNAARIDSAIDNPRSREVLQLLLRGPLKKVHLFNDERQSLTESEEDFAFEGRRISLDRFNAARLPISDPEVAEWQKPTLFVQSDHERMIETAGRIVGDEDDAFKVARMLSDWVSDNVRSTFSARLTNSLEVLDNMEGDCTEHSMLFIGLARAAGLPAREVAGLIYVEAPQPGFYFHQWATVWVGKWIDVDPTFDQPIADATHIKLAEGDLFEQAKLLPIIGKIEIEVVD